MQKADLIFKNGYILTMDQNFTQYPGGAIAVSGSKIAAVGNTKDILAQYEAGQIIDLNGKALMPGLINGHCHIPMVLMRCFADDLKLDEWLHKYVMPAEVEFEDEAYVRTGTALGCAELIHGGVTTVVEMYYFEDQVCQVADQMGMRGILGETILDFPSPTYKKAGDWVNDVEQYCEKWKGHPRIQYTLAPHAIYSCREETYRKCTEIVNKYNLPIMTHICETQADSENALRQNGCSTVQSLEKWGFFDTCHAIGAHCIYLDDQDIQTMVRHQAGAIHCPSSNMKIGTGAMKSREMLHAGVKLGIGTDGAASNNSIDMVEEIRLASLLAKESTADPTAMTARETLLAATRLGAEAVGLGDKIGSLEPGKQADLTIAALNHVSCLPHYHHNENVIYSQIVYCLKSADICDVLVDGKFLMKNYQLQTLPDRDELRAQAQKIADRISSHFSK